MNVSSVKNLNGETFSAVQDTFLTNIVSSNSANWNEISAYQANSGNFLTAVPDTYLQNTDLTIADNKVTEISGIPLSAGTELEFEYDVADNISAINNSAISTTPAQALYAQNPLYFSATGTSSYMGINSADLARMLGVDETLLWETNEVLYQENSAVTLSENFKNFKELDVYYQSPPDDNYTANKSLNIFRIDPTRVDTAFSIGGNYILGNDWWVTWCLRIGTSADGTSMYITNAHHTWGQSAYSNGFGDFSNNGQKACGGIYKVVGIGRKEV